MFNHKHSLISSKLSQVITIPIACTRLVSSCHPEAPDHLNCWETFPSPCPVGLQCWMLNPCGAPSSCWSHATSRRSKWTSGAGPELKGEIEGPELMLYFASSTGKFRWAMIPLSHPIVLVFNRCPYPSIFERLRWTLASFRKQKISWSSALRAVALTSACIGSSEIHRGYNRAWHIRIHRQSQSQIHSNPNFYWSISNTHVYLQVSLIIVGKYPTVSLLPTCFAQFPTSPRLAVPGDVHLRVSHLRLRTRTTMTVIVIVGYCDCHRIIPTVMGMVFVDYS